jgi:hypothetical protein
MFGLVGGPLNILSGTLVMFGVLDQGGTGQGLATIPSSSGSWGLASTQPSGGLGRHRSFRGKQGPRSDESPSREHDKYGASAAALPQAFGPDPGRFALVDRVVPEPILATPIQARSPRIAPGM